MKREQHSVQLKMQLAMASSSEKKTQAEPSALPSSLPRPDVWAIEPITPDTRALWQDANAAILCPQAWTTLCRVVCSPPRSSVAVALPAPRNPPWRLGNNSTGLRCSAHKRHQVLMGGLRQGHEAAVVALGVAHGHAGARGLDLADLKPLSFVQAQSQAVEGEEEHLVARHAWRR